MATETCSPRLSYQIPVSEIVTTNFFIPESCQNCGQKFKHRRQQIQYLQDIFCVSLIH